MYCKLAVILGSGIEIDNRKVTDVSLIHEEKDSAVHKKSVYTCRFNGHNILVIKGRKHFYEGYDYRQLTENINFLSENGTQNLVITNAAGGVNENFRERELMLIRSHVNLNSALIFKNYSFPYDTALSELFIEACSNTRVKLHEGVYGYYQGPTYETKSEMRFQKKFDIDAAGMSTIPEVNSAYSKGIRVIGISVITNLLKENDAQPASHEDVLESASSASENLNKALGFLLESI